MAVAAYQLKSELARVCLPAPEQDANRRLAWVNSVCLFFLVIGVVGARSRLPVPVRPAPIEQPIPIVVEPTVAPPVATEQKQVEPQTQDERDVAPTVVAVTLDTPAINFSVPTIGNLVVPVAAAPAPPPVALRQEAPAPLRKGPTVTADTGENGDRPRPTYPDLAYQLGQQGSVLVDFTVDDVGAVETVTVKETSGFSLLDRGAREWIKRHWIQPPISGNHIFEVTIRYKLGPEQ
jgi:TonB family protein